MQFPVLILGLTLETFLNDLLLGLTGRKKLKKVSLQFISKAKLFTRGLKKILLDRGMIALTGHSERLPTKIT